MNKYQKDFNYEVVDLDAASNVGQILYDICDWLITLNIGFTSYTSNIVIQDTTSSTKMTYWYAYLKNSEVGKDLCLYCCCYLYYDGDGNVIGFQSNYNYSSFSIGSCKFGDCERLSTVSQDISLTSYNSNYGILKFSITVYHKNNSNIIIGIENTSSKTVYGLNAVFMMLCTANNEQLYSITKIPLCTLYSSSGTYGVLTNGITTQKYNFRAILDRYYLALTGSAMLVKVPLTLYGSTGNTDYDTLNFDYIYQTNKSYLEAGSIYTINGKDYLCFNETMGMLLEC